MRVLTDHLCEVDYRQGIPSIPSFFETIDRYIKDTWARGECPTRDQAIRHTSQHLQPSLPDPILEQLLDRVYVLYAEELKPDLAKDAREFLEWSSRRWPVYLVSDTYTLPGSVLDEILSRDGILQLFRSRLYSDQLGCKKPDPTAIEQISKRELVPPDRILHIGDLVETDGELARRAGCRCIIVRSRHSDVASREIEDTAIIGYCRDLIEAKELIGAKA
jgi:FMN phosphatase YigB (HAD superfamily)